MTDAAVYLTNTSFTIIPFLLFSEIFGFVQVSKCQELYQNLEPTTACEMNHDWFKPEAVLTSDWFRSGHVFLFWPIRCERRLAVGISRKAFLVLYLTSGGRNSSISSSFSFFFSKQ